jgi:hypothetical protein
MPETININPKGNDYDRIFNSKYYGQFKIIQDLGMINKVHMVRIKFIESKYESEVALNQVKYGQVRDASRFPVYEKDGYGTKIYHSNNYGDYIILRDLPKKNEFDKDRRCIIKFIETGYEYEVGYQEALCGNVKDPHYGIDYNKEYQSNKSGPYKIVEYLGSNNKARWVIIEFSNTGNRVRARLDHVEEGNVLDPSIVKFFRPGVVSNNESKDYYRLYKRWDSMIRRCLDENDYRYKSYNNINICERWMLFSNYIEDVINLPGYCKAVEDLSNYHLDKDLLHMLYNTPKMYSPETCIWLNAIDNITIKKTVPHMLSYGCIIIPLPNGDFEGIIKINGIVLEHAIYPLIHTMYDRFIYFITPKIMCEIIN